MELQNPIAAAIALVLELGALAYSLAGAIAGFLAVTGVFGVLVGGHDLGLSDEPLSVNATGALLLAAGVLVLWAAGVLIADLAGIVPAQVWSARLVLSSCLVVAVGAFFFLIAEIASVENDWRVLGSATIVGCLALASFGVLRRKVKVTVGKAGPLLLGLVGTVFGVFQFWYAQQYLPTRQPPALEATTTLEPIGVSVGGLDGYKATLSLKNAGSTKVLAIAGAYMISGSQIPPREPVPSPERVLEPFVKLLYSQAPDPYAGRFSRHAGEKSQTILQAGRLFAENRYFEPGQELSREYVVFVPSCRYGLLRLRGEVVVAKGALLRLGDQIPPVPGFFHDPGRVGVYAFWHVEDNSWVHDILDGKEQSILVNYVTNDTEQFDVSSFRVTAWLVSGTEKRTPAQIADYTKRAHERIGLVETFSDFEFPVKQAPRSAATGGC